MFWEALGGFGVWGRWGVAGTHLQPTQPLLAQLAHQGAQGNRPRLPHLGGQLLPIQLVLGVRKWEKNREKEKGVCFSYG